MEIEKERRNKREAYKKREFDRNEEIRCTCSTYTQRTKRENKKEREMQRRNKREAYRKREFDRNIDIRCICSTYTQRKIK